MEQLILPALIIIVVILILKAKKKAAPTRVSEVPIQPAPPRAPSDYNEFLYREGLEPERFSSHQQFVRDTYSDSLLLGSSKSIVRDDPNDINPYLGLRRPNYNVAVGAGARQVPTEDRDQLPNVRAPTFA